MIGRPISRVEALQIVRQILEQAERERIEMADFEAARPLPNSPGAAIWTAVKEWLAKWKVGKA